MAQVEEEKGIPMIFGMPCPVGQKEEKRAGMGEA